MPAEGGDAVQITRHGGTVALVSADGQRLYYRRAAAGAISEIGADGTGDAEVVRAPSTRRTLRGDAIRAVVRRLVFGLLGSWRHYARAATT
jgi:antitoxin (DNA-binding transcriptional repressor) of toxin-antitoxin stability system